MCKQSFWIIFLGASSSYVEVWRQRVTSKLQEDPAAATASVQQICARVMLRRTQETVDANGVRPTDRGTLTSHLWYESSWNRHPGSV